MAADQQIRQLKIQVGRGKEDVHADMIHVYMFILYIIYLLI